MITKTGTYEQHLNKHHVIYIDFSRMPFECDSYKDYIGSIYKKLRKDIFSVYDLDDDYDSPQDMLNATGDSFIFILDEWDSIFYKKFMRNQDDDKISYLEFLNGLLKGQPSTAHHSAYVELVYMTGVLPIAKYSALRTNWRSGSALNVFKEYSFLDDHMYDAFFGFSEHEVRKLCEEKKTIPYDQLHFCAQSEILV